MEFYHDPVMKEEVLQYLQVQPGKIIVDCTLGGGGHSEAILELLAGKGMLCAFDRDPDALKHAEERLASYANKQIFYSEFSHLADRLDVESVDGVLCDLGISSRQVDNGERGFSFKNSDRVDLRMNPSDPLDAKTWLREESEKNIATAFSRNADLKKAHRLAQALKNLAQEKAGDLLMGELLEIVAKIFPEKRKDQGALAARILQAIRMEINNELSEIREVIAAGEKVLKSGGRMVFLTYHSVEDRLVKQLFRALEETDKTPRNIPVNPKDIPQPIFKKVLRKAMAPSEIEISRNPRARSAKMRVYEKV